MVNKDSPIHACWQFCIAVNHIFLFLLPLALPHWQRLGSLHFHKGITRRRIFRTSVYLGSPESATVLILQQGEKTYIIDVRYNLPPYANKDKITPRNIVRIT